MHVLCIPTTLWRQPSGTQEVWPRNTRVYALGVRAARPLSGGCYGVLFAEEAQTLFQHRSGKQKPFGVLQSDWYLPRSSMC